MTIPYQFSYFMLRFFFLPILKCCFRFEVQGMEHVQCLKGGAILAGNHTGYLDGPLVLAAYPHVFRFLTTEVVLSWPVVGPWVKRVNTVILPKQQQHSALKFLIQELKQGKHFCIFPEGRLTQSGEFNEFKDGVAFIQQKANVPIIPFAIHGGFEALPEGKRWPKFRKITLCFGKPIQASKERSKTTKALKEAIQSLKSHLEGVEEFLEERKLFVREKVKQQREQFGIYVRVNFNCANSINTLSRY